MTAATRWVLDSKEARLREAKEETQGLRKQLDEYAEAFRQVLDERDSARRERDEAHQKIQRLREQLGGTS